MSDAERLAALEARCDTLERLVRDLLARPQQSFAVLPAISRRPPNPLPHGWPTTTCAAGCAP